MKITKAHREVFKKALEFWDEQLTNFLCCHIDSVKAPLALRRECKEILFHYFADHPNRSIIWVQSLDNLTFEETKNCRLIALYSLIYMPT